MNIFHWTLDRSHCSLLIRPELLFRFLIVGSVLMILNPIQASTGIGSLVYLSILFVYAAALGFLPIIIVFIARRRRHFMSTATQVILFPTYLIVIWALVKGGLYLSHNDPILVEVGKRMLVIGVLQIIGIILFSIITSGQTES